MHTVGANKERKRVGKERKKGKERGQREGPKRGKKREEERDTLESAKDKQNNVLIDH